MAEDLDRKIRNLLQAAYAVETHRHVQGVLANHIEPNGRPLLAMLREAMWPLAEHGITPVEDAVRAAVAAERERWVREGAEKAPGQ